MEGDMRQTNLVYVATSGRGVLYGSGPGLNISAPSFPAQGVVNAASYQGGGVSPGELVTIFGQSMGPTSLAPTALDEAGSLSDMLQGTQIFFDGFPAPLVYAFAGQVSAMVPYSVAGNSTTSIEASYLGVLSPPVSMPVLAAAPSILTQSAQGSGAGVILNSDYSVNTPANPAARGDYVTIYATGEGQTSPPGVDGRITTGISTLPLLTVTAQIGGIDAHVYFAGEAPGIVAGVLQVNAQVPPDANPGPAVPVTISVGGGSTQPNVTVAVK
jgi:uncharacterized protein (TIGR03437 family)